LLFGIADTVEVNLYQYVVLDYGSLFGNQSPPMRFITASAVLLAGSMLFGCSSTPKATDTAVAPPLAPQPTAPAAPVAKAAPATSTVPEYLDPNSPVAKERSVFFGYDDYAVKPDYRNVIEIQGRYLASHPNVSVRVEGNTDERGSSEYNLALGQRRAEAVVKALRLMGAKDSQMEPVSWGKEKPRAQGHDESAWAQNRRADVVYPAR
jgi:peptidoglycan-associated lipoprotein